MPTRPPRPCSSGCPELVTSGHCPLHTKEHDRARRPDWVRAFYSSTRWKHLREWKRRHNPLCEYCEEEGQQEPATSVDHIVPLTVAPDHGLDPTNLKSSCWRHQRTNSRKRPTASHLLEHPLSDFLHGFRLGAHGFGAGTHLAGSLDGLRPQLQGSGLRVLLLKSSCWQHQRTKQISY